MKAIRTHLGVVAVVGQFAETPTGKAEVARPA